ncbi:1,4-dihydroxy-2-naphthoyl-CoA synthase, peroxisomal [Trifolium repens]|nr:1,4-dihydroxy-2-naphthoyl-CoA synthase, peroxisomal [Trifolium repens]
MKSWVLRLLNFLVSLLKVGSFVVGYGSSIMLSLVGLKKACKMWFLTRFYTDKAEKTGLINTWYDLLHIFINARLLMHIIIDSNCDN